MTDIVAINEARRMLVALLQKPDDGPVVGLDEISPKDKLYLVTTCSATMIEHAICATCGNDLADALEGLEALVVSMREHMMEACK